MSLIVRHLINRQYSGVLTYIFIFLKFFFYVYECFTCMPGALGKQKEESDPWS